MNTIRALTIHELNNDDLKTLHYKNVKYDELSRQDKCLFEINETLRYVWKYIADDTYYFANIMYHGVCPPRFFKPIKELYKKQNIDLKYVVNGGINIKLITNKKYTRRYKRKAITSMSNETRKAIFG